MPSILNHELILVPQQKRRNRSRPIQYRTNREGPLFMFKFGKAKKKSSEHVVAWKWKRNAPPPPTQCLYEMIRSKRYVNYMNDSRLNALGQFSNIVNSHVNKTRTYDCTKESSSDPCTHTTAFGPFDPADMELLHTFCQRADGVYLEWSVATRCQYESSSSLKQVKEESFIRNKPNCVPSEYMSSCHSSTMVDAWMWYDVYTANRDIGVNPFENWQGNDNDNVCEMGLVDGVPFPDEPTTSPSNHKSKAIVQEHFPRTAYCALYRETFHDTADDRTLSPEYQHINDQVIYTSNCSDGSSNFEVENNSENLLCRLVDDYRSVQHVLPSLCSIVKGHYVESTYQNSCKRNTHNQIAMVETTARPRCILGNVCQERDVIFLESILYSRLLSANCTATLQKSTDEGIVTQHTSWSLPGLGSGSQFNLVLVAALSLLLCWIKVGRRQSQTTTVSYQHTATTEQDQDVAGSIQLNSFPT